MLKEKKGNRIALSRLIHFIGSYKKQIAVLALLSTVSSLFFLVSPYLSKLFIDKALLLKDSVWFVRIFIIGAGVFVASIGFKIIDDIAKNRIGLKLRLQLTSAFMRKLDTLGLGFFQARSVGEQAYRLSDIETVAGFVVEQCPRIFADGLKFIVICIISLRLSPQMSICLFILSPFFLVHRYYMQKKVAPMYEEIWKNRSILSKQAYESFGKMAILKALGLEAHQRHRYLKAFIAHIRLQLRSFRWGIIGLVSSSLTSRGVYGAIALYGGWLILKGLLSLGTYTAVMVYLTQLGTLLESLGYGFQDYTRQIVSLEKFFEIMDTQPQICDAQQPMVPASIKGEIRFEQVWFGYQPDKPVFKGLDITIPASSWVAIVGPSGCGKTTLANLLLRLYDPGQGRITVNQIDLKDIQLKALRKRISIATQQPFLFDVSIGENISYGLAGIRPTQIEEAGRISGLQEYVASLPQGYKTAVGEDACWLAQGLKQRLAIARAVLRAPDILILDEATASVDSGTEAQIFQALRASRKGLVTIVIGHRLSSIKDADRIYFLTQDGAFEEGTHNELLAHSQGYRRFFSQQMDNR